MLNRARRANVHIKKKPLWALLGVLTSALFAAAVSHAASFDCSKAAGAVEQAICKSKTLGALDVENARLYSRIVERGVNPREIMVADQRKWLAEERNKCKAEQCIALSIWQRSGMFRTTLERSGVKTADIAEVASNAQDLERMVATSATQAPAAQSASKEGTIASPTPAPSTPAARPSASPADSISPVGPRLSEAQAQGIFNTRLGRCAAAFGVQKAYDRAEQLMAGSTNTQLTRGTYVALLRQAITEPDLAKENYMDACRAIGMVNGTKENAARFEFNMTAYEAVNPKVRPEGLAVVAEGLARANTAQQQRDAQQVRDADPVPRLQAALGQFRSTQCAEIYARDVRKTLRDIEGIRADAARSNPQARLDPRSSSEMLVSQHGDTLLRAIRSNGCL
jgi:uncharacterized protein